MALDARVRGDKVAGGSKNISDQVSSRKQGWKNVEDEHETTRDIDRLDVAVDLPVAGREEHGLGRVRGREVGDVVESVRVGEDVEVARWVGRRERLHVAGHDLRVE